nr:MAG TPA: hypothetical protein [Caudoviricetes sp.]
MHRCNKNKGEYVVDTAYSLFHWENELCLKT